MAAHSSSGMERSAPMRARPARPHGGHFSDSTNKTIRDGDGSSVMNRINKIQRAVVSRVFMSKKDRSKMTELKQQIKNDLRDNFVRSESSAPTRSDIEKLVSDRLGKRWYNKTLVGHLVDYAKSNGPEELRHGTMILTERAIPESPPGTAESKPSRVKLLKSPTLQRGHIEIYETDSLIASGGFGSVYRGPKYVRDGTSEPVAMKIVSPKNAYASQERTALRAWNDIGSPNLVKYHCSTETGDMMMLFMEQCEQDTLDFASKLKSIPEQEMPLAEKEKIMRSVVAQLLQGMAALHRHGFKHLDIKPGNAMLSCDGVLKIIDAGFATQETSAEHCGTPGFMAPEFDAQQPDIDLKMCDAYSAGMTIMSLFDEAGLTSETHEAVGNPVYFDAFHFLCNPDPDVRMSIDDFLTTGLFQDIYPPDELTRTLLQHKLISGTPQPGASANESRASSPSETGATQGSGSSRRDLPDEDLFSSMRGPTRAAVPPRKGGILSALGWQSKGHGAGRRAAKAQEGEVDLYSYFRERADWQPKETKPSSTAASSKAPYGGAAERTPPNTGADPGIAPQAAHSGAAKPNPRK